MMPDEAATGNAHRELASKIVAAYVRRNQVATDQIPMLITTVHQALAGLGKPTAEIGGDRTPAVPIRRSVHRDYVICLDCAWRGQMLSRHITAAHGLSVEAYRARWNLPPDHALTAPAYSERRSGIAKNSDWVVEARRHQPQAPTWQQQKVPWQRNRRGGGVDHERQKADYYQRRRLT
jgi:predicted transcriptional regulator